MKKHCETRKKKCYSAKSSQRRRKKKGSNTTLWNTRKLKKARLAFGFLTAENIQSCKRRAVSKKHQKKEKINENIIEENNPHVCYVTRRETQARRREMKRPCNLREERNISEGMREVSLTSAETLYSFWLWRHMTACEAYLFMKAGPQSVVQWLIEPVVSGRLCLVCSLFRE